MLLSSFDLGLTFSQIVVFEPDLEHPFNDWKQEHINQGFAWRPGSVSFRTLGSGTRVRVEVWMSDAFELRADTVRAIQVPYQIDSSRAIAIQDVSSQPDENIIQIPEGDYALVFEIGFVESLRANPQYQGRLEDLLPMWCKFTFIPDENVEPAILRADLGLSPIPALCMEADPA